MTKAERQRANVALKALEAAQRETALNARPDPLPRGLKFYFSPREWRVLAGFEVNGGTPQVRVDFYLGVGPALVRLTV